VRSYQVLIHMYRSVCSSFHVAKHLYGVIWVWITLQDWFLFAHKGLCSGHIAKGCFGKFLGDVIWHSIRTDPCTLNCDLVPLVNISIVPPVLTFLITMCISSEVASIPQIVHMYLSFIYCQDTGCGWKHICSAQECRCFHSLQHKDCDSNYRKLQESIIQKVRNNYHSIVFKT
jgi:hypothetical protein